MTERNALDTMSVMCEDRASRDYTYGENSSRYAIAFGIIELTKVIKKQLEAFEEALKRLPS